MERNALSRILGMGFGIWDLSHLEYWFWELGYLGYRFLDLGYLGYRFGDFGLSGILVLGGVIFGI